MQITGKGPSAYTEDFHFFGSPPADEPYNGASWWNPVETISWEDSIQGLMRADLTLPSLHQWDYAAGAGAGTRYWTGSDSASLRGAANLADALVQSAAVRPTGTTTRSLTTVGRFMLQSGSFARTQWVCMTCTETCGNGPERRSLRGLRRVWAAVSKLAGCTRPWESITGNCGHPDARRGSSTHARGSRSLKRSRRCVPGNSDGLHNSPMARDMCVPGSKAAIDAAPRTGPMA